MSRIDKYNPEVGGFRAPSNIAWLAADVGVVFGVGLNGSGRVVKGAGSTGIIGLVCVPSVKAAGDVIDVMTDGEIADFTLNVAATAAAAGTRYFGVAADGTLSTTNTGTRVGWTVEAGRLVVRVGRGTNPST